MAYTEQTTHYGLPLPTAGDRSTFLDTNEAFGRIDSALYEAKTDSSANKTDMATVKSQVAQAESDIASVETDVETLKTSVALNTNNINGAMSDIDTAQADIVKLKADMVDVQGDVSDLDTSVQSLKTTVQGLPTGQTVQQAIESAVDARVAKADGTYDLENGGNVVLSGVQGLGVAADGTVYYEPKGGAGTVIPFKKSGDIKIVYHARGGYMVALSTIFADIEKNTVYTSIATSGIMSIWDIYPPTNDYIEFTGTSPNITMRIKKACEVAIFQQTSATDGTQMQTPLELTFTSYNAGDTVALIQTSTNPAVGMSTLIVK